ncbi:MAG: hypothetical protein ACPHRO_00700 [Nannocystaceae bacterium]
MSDYAIGKGLAGIGPVRGPLVLVRRNTSLPREVDLALATLLAEREMTGLRDRFVTVAVRTREDFGWVGRAIRWLSDHGRQPIARLRVPPDANLVRTLRDVGAIAVVEVVNTNVEIQRLLLGPSCAPMGELLLAAQHLRAAGLPVVARLGPLLPGIHGSCGRGTHAFRSLLSHLKVADIRDVEIVFGHLDQQRLLTLESAIDAEQMMELARAFGISTGELLALGAQKIVLQGPRSMAPMIASVFRMELQSAIRREEISLRMAGEIAARQSENVGREFAPVHRGVLQDISEGTAIS